MKEKNQEVFESFSEISEELLLDTQLHESLIKEIPIAKTIWTFYKAGKSLNDFLYLKKLKLFLENIQDINEDDYQRFVKDGEKEQERLKNSLLLILDKIEDETKAILIANAFKIYVKERFSFETFNRILSIINRGFCADLLKITFFDGRDVLLTNGEHIELESLEDLFSCGLLANAGFDGGSARPDSGGTRYMLNKYGEIFLRIVKEYENQKQK
jgi:hypothetical protein